MRVLVSGATGTTGGEVLRQLRAAGVEVRAMSRSQQAAARFQADGIEAAVADLAAPDTLAPALQDVDAVYVANPASAQLAEHEGSLARAAATAGVRHLVKLSVIGASPDSPITFGRMHHGSEQAIASSGISATMVRPNGFMQNTLAWAAQIPGGVIRGPVMDARWSIVDVRDVAAVAVAALQDAAAHGGRAYAVTGLNASSPREQVAILSEVLNLPLRAEEVTIEQAQQTMLACGWPQWSVERMGELFRLYAEGLATETSGDVEQVTGRPPHGYRQFAVAAIDTRHGRRSNR